MAENRFSDVAANAAIESARNHYDTNKLAAMADENVLSGALEGELSLLAECITVTVADNKVCVTLPLGIGKKCLPIPVSIPNGEVGQACLSLCTTFGIPTGAKVTVTIMNKVVVSQTFGKC